MSRTVLIVTVCLLGVCVALILTTPTTQDYAVFLQARLDQTVQRMDATLSEQERSLLRGLYGTQGKKLVDLVVQQHTRRKNLGLFCLFESTVQGQKMIVLGVATRLIPVEGVEEATLKLGQLVPTLRR